MSRADMTHDLIESCWGDLPDMPLHEPVFRTDTHRVVEISDWRARAGLPALPQRDEMAQCCGSCGQGRVACPSPAVCHGVRRGAGPVREVPASCSPISTAGVSLGAVLGVVTIAFVSVGLLLGWL